PGEAARLVHAQLAAVSDETTRARLLALDATCCFDAGDSAGAVARARAALASATRAAEPLDTGHAGHVLAMALAATGELDEAEAQGGDARRAFAAAADPLGVVRSTLTLAIIARRRGRLA